MSTGGINDMASHTNLAEIQAEILRIAAQVVEIQGSISMLVDTIREDHSGPEWEAFLNLTIDEADTPPLSVFLHGRLRLIAEENLDDLARELCQVGLMQAPDTAGEQANEDTGTEPIETGLGPPECAVVPAGPAFAVERDDGTRVAVFAEPMQAYLAAAILSVVDEGFVYRLISADPGCRVTTSDGSRTVGWLLEQSPETIEALEVAERIVRSPMELSLFLEAADPRVLAIAQRFADTRRRSFLRRHAPGKKITPDEKED